MYQPKPGTFFSRRGLVFRCLYIDEVSILFENADGDRFLDTSSDDFVSASGWPEDVEVWDKVRQLWVRHFPCPGEKRVRVDYHDDLENLEVYAVKRRDNGFDLVSRDYPPKALTDWVISLS